jgi:hypothetical protein
MMVGKIVLNKPLTQNRNEKTIRAFVCDTKEEAR